MSHTEWRPARAAFTVRRAGEPVPPPLAGAAVAIGNFDGVHRGHQELVATAVAAAAESGRASAVLTFEPHPRRFFRPDQPLFRLTPEPVKLAILAELGLDAAFVSRFDAALADLSAQAFVDDLLVASLAVGSVVVGHDFHFGHGREGNPALLQELCARHGIGCTIVPPVLRDGRPVSSTAIRTALEEGRIGEANDLLGYRWFVSATVRHGDKRGRTLGFPTANLALDPDCGLRHGIYAVRAAVGGGEIRDGVASFGRRPTFDDGPPLLEVFLFDFAGDLYGRNLDVEFAGWIRGEERFENAEALVARMQADAAEARRILAAADGLRSFLA